MGKQMPMFGRMIIFYHVVRMSTPCQRVTDENNIYYVYPWATILVVHGIP